MSAIPDWARAHGEPLLAAGIRASAAEFTVTEINDFAFSGSGEHDYLWVEKRGNNTQWVAECLARHAGVPVRDVGFAGMKDRHAVTRQWFSVRRQGATHWNRFAGEGIRICDQQRHQRKLRRGAHQGNEFRVALRAAGIGARRADIEARLALLAQDGAPNYFGEQRFGRADRNVDLSERAFAGQRMSRAKRGIALSAARSLVFNSILDSRVRAGNWNRILPGEIANLDGSGSVFSVDDVSSDLMRRCQEQDIHPTASLWGEGAPRGQRQVAAIETEAATQLRSVCDGISAAGMTAASRALRLRVSKLQWEFEAGLLWLSFTLAKGAYATAVLREIAELHNMHQG